jgi:hypothetical protein
MNITYKTIQDIASDKNYPFSLGQLRSFILKRQENGLDKAVRKIGKRIYIRIDLFDEWIEKH